jgi:hypothetical protein
MRTLLALSWGAFVCSIVQLLFSVAGFGVYTEHLIGWSDVLFYLTLAVTYGVGLHQFYGRGW